MHLKHVFFLFLLLQAKARGSSSSVAHGAPGASLPTVSGGAQVSVGAAPLSGQPGSSSGNLSGPSAQGTCSHHDCGDALLRKVEDLISGGKSQDTQQKEAFIAFLKSSLPTIDESIFAEYYGNVAQYTRRMAELSREIVKERARASQAPQQQQQGPQGSGGAGGGQGPSSGLPSSGVAAVLARSDGLTGEMVNPSAILRDPKLPLIVGVDQVHRGTSGEVTEMTTCWSQAMPPPPPPQSPPMMSQAMGTVPEPQPSTSTGRGIYSGPAGSYSGIQQDLSQSPPKFRAQYPQYAGPSAAVGCCTVNFTSAAPTVTTVTSGQETLTYTNMTNVSLADLSSSSQGGFIPVTIPEAVRQATETVDNQPTFSDLSPVPALNFKPLNPGNRRESDPVNLNTPQPRGHESEEDV